jgi:hypothetical protein
LDWEHLKQRLGDDVLLLAGLLHVFAWLCPDRAASLPTAAADLLTGAVSHPQRSSACDHHPQRIALLDGRPWFVPLVKRQPEHAES